MAAPPRPYYDHEQVYQSIANDGGTAWDDHSNDGPSAFVHLDEFLASALCPSPRFGASVIDLGCGGGQAGLRAASRGFVLTGVDYSETAVRLACTNAAVAKVAATFVVGDCLTLDDIESEQFDLALDNHALHCLVTPGDRASFLATTFRVLKPGGVFFSTTMSAEGGLDYAAMGVDPSSRINARGNRYWTTLAELGPAMRGAGFAVSSMTSQSDGSGPQLDIVTVACRPSLLGPA